MGLVALREPGARWSALNRPPNRRRREAGEDFQPAGRRHGSNRDTHGHSNRGRSVSAIRRRLDARVFFVHSRPPKFSRRPQSGFACARRCGRRRIGGLSQYGAIRLVDAAQLRLSTCELDPPRDQWRDAGGFRRSRRKASWIDAFSRLLRDDGHRGRLCASRHASVRPGTGGRRLGRDLRRHGGDRALCFRARRSARRTGERATRTKDSVLTRSRNSSPIGEP